jgi:hypothetical protein
MKIRRRHKLAAELVPHVNKNIKMRNKIFILHDKYNKLALVAIDQ